MKDYSNLQDFSDKQLRTLRNNLNNRLEAFKNGNDKKLPPSHKLYGMEEGQCKMLLDDVYTEMKRRAEA